MWEESLLFRNLGPFSRIHDEHIRPFMGRFFAAIGTLIYHFLVWLDLPWEDKTNTAKKQSKGFVQRTQQYLR